MIGILPRFPDRHGDSGMSLFEAPIIRECLRQTGNHRWTRRGQAASREAKSQKSNHGFHGYHGLRTDAELTSRNRFRLQG